MGRDKAKKKAEKEMDENLANILLEFEATMCRIWQTDNYAKGHDLKLIVDYKILNKSKIKLSTQLAVVK